MADAIGNAVSNSVAGLYRAERQLADAASKIATGLRSDDTTGATSPTAKAPDFDPTAAILQVNEARNAFSANAAVLETTDQLTRKILDIKV